MFMKDRTIAIRFRQCHSFDDYREDVGKLAKRAEQVEFTIIKEPIRHGRINLHKDVKT
jgi:hypothetical protein